MEIVRVKIGKIKNFKLTASAKVEFLFMVEKLFKTSFIYLHFSTFQFIYKMNYSSGATIGSVYST